MRRQASQATMVAFTVFATLVASAVAYGAATGALYRGHGGARLAAATDSGRQPSPVDGPLATPASKPVTPAPASQAPPARPGGLVLVDADIFEAPSGWALLTNCVQPMTGGCHYFVTSTGDGVNWSKPVQVGGDFDPTDGDAPRHLRFVNSGDGFAYGGSVAFATHDAGSTWTRLQLPLTFIGLIDGRTKTAWVVGWPCAKGAPCSYAYLVSADGGVSWSKPASLPAGFAFYDGASVGDYGLLLWAGSSGALESTFDGGATWTAIQSPCAGNVEQQVVATDGIALWDLCFDYPAAAAAQATRTLFVTRDFGHTWSSRAMPAVGAMQAGNGYINVAAASGDGAFVTASNQSAMTLTRNGGDRWSQVGPDGLGFRSIRFAIPPFGVAIDVTGGIWVSTDEGADWTRRYIALPGQA